MQEGKHQSNVGVFLGGGDKVEVVVLDVDKGGVAMGDDGGHVVVLLPIHHQRHELVNHRHVNVTAVIAADQHLEVKIMNDSMRVSSDQ